MRQAQGMTVFVMSKEVRKDFFFEKKKQKTFLIWGIGFETGADHRSGVFFVSFLFTKKKNLYCPDQRRPGLQCAA